MRRQSVVLVMLGVVVVLASCSSGERQAKVTAEDAHVVSKLPGKKKVALASLDDIKGPVDVISHGATVKAEDGHALFLRDKAKTGTAAKAQLLFLETAKVRLREETQVEILSNGLRVRRGTTWFDVERQEKEFVVKVPGALLAVLGTSFGVIVDRDGTTQVRLDSGKVEVRTAKGTTVLEPGSKIVVDNYGRVRAKSAAGASRGASDAFGDIDRHQDSNQEMGGDSPVLETPGATTLERDD